MLAFEEVIVRFAAPCLSCLPKSSKYQAAEHCGSAGAHIESERINYKISLLILSNTMEPEEEPKETVAVEDEPAPAALADDVVVGSSKKKKVRIRQFCKDVAQSIQQHTGK